MSARESKERQGRELAFEEIESWPDAVDGGDLLDEIAIVVSSYIILPPGAVHAIALWTVFAHAHPCFDTSPILVIRAPEKQCGKSRTLAVVGALVPRPMFAAAITPATVFRSISEYNVTLMIDEFDALSKDVKAELRGILNAGHSESGSWVPRCDGKDHQVRLFSVWCPKAIASIESLAETLEDRSIAIVLKRKAAGETVERLRTGRIGAELRDLRRKIQRWDAATH